VAFTKRKITHVITEPSGAAASGSVEFTLSHRVTNGAETIVPGSVSGALNASGELSVELPSNVDTGTTPGDSQYRVDFRITGAAPETFWIVVPTGPGTTDLGSLLPKETPGG
jgi:hypothetical protein